MRTYLVGLEYIESRSIPEPNTGCWLWLGEVTRDGYGKMVRVCTKEVFAHRYSLISAVGPIGELYALHTCDVRSCVNPEHLYAGTQADNIRDMMQRNRFYTPPINTKRVEAIFEARNKGESYSSIGERLGVSRQRIHQIDVAMIRTHKS